jgi:acyl-CoA synthetase (AMP-forming)/AMP-acid ligase II
MIVRGLKHDPHDVELTVEACDPSVRPGCVAAFTIDTESEDVALLAEVEAGDAGPSVLSPVIEAIRAGVAEAHGIQLSAIALLPPGSLPKTTSGKLQRFACRESLRSGSLVPLIRWEASESGWPLERTA